MSKFVVRLDLSAKCYPSIPGNGIQGLEVTLARDVINYCSQEIGMKG